MKSKTSRKFSLLLIVVAVIDFVTTMVCSNGSTYLPNMFSVILTIVFEFGIIFLTIWAVRSRDRKYPIFASICLIVPTFFDFFNSRSTHELYLQLSLLLAFAVLLIFSFLGFRHNKVLFVIMLIVGIVYIQYGIYPYYYFGWSLDVIAYNWDWFVYILFPLLFSLLRSIWFILYGVFILLGGQPLNKVRPVKRGYIPSKADNISTRLNKIKSDYESGKITEDDYQKYRMELLKEISKKK